ncbi:hypothetical protein L6452_37004 [Arctium lappa]|uniref:Uncharacterized protein n=1 Tax=Arctium lappa TaxID=4217 RepID=A0ACB8Y1R6_ARCLA|nr:hypothetical protein L6452_37004 [Arctium lappa]
MFSKVNIRFGTRVDDLIVENGHVVGVNISDSSGRLQFSSEKLGFDAVVLAVGHSARDVYQMLLSHNIKLLPKDFAVGLRIEHPQELINIIQVSKIWSELMGLASQEAINQFKALMDQVDEPLKRTFKVLSKHYYDGVDAAAFCFGSSLPTLYKKIKRQ